MKKTTKTKPTTTTQSGRNAPDGRASLTQRVQSEHATFSSEELQRTIEHKSQLVAISVAMKDKAQRTFLTAQDDIMAADHTIEALGFEIAAIHQLIERREEP